MPSPYGKHRGADSYYQYGGEPQRYVYNWTGMPFPSPTKFGPASLGCVGCKDTWPVAQTMEYPDQTSVMHSGPEQWGIHDGLHGVQMSRNEKLWLGLGVASIAAYFAWKKFK